MSSATAAKPATSLSSSATHTSQFRSITSLIGAVLAAVPDGGPRSTLERIQNELFDLGADLSVPFEVGDRLRIEQAAVDRLEEDCDRFNAGLEPLKSFVLPGGTEAAARL